MRVRNRTVLLKRDEGKGAMRSVMLSPQAAPWRKPAGSRRRLCGGSVFRPVRGAGSRTRKPAGSRRRLGGGLTVPSVTCAGSRPSQPRARARGLQHYRPVRQPAGLRQRMCVCNVCNLPRTRLLCASKTVPTSV
jgi:hypothetical protein